MRDFFAPEKSAFRTFSDSRPSGIDKAGAGGYNRSMNPDSDALGQERTCIMQDIESLFSFIEASPAAPGAVAEAVRRLTDAGFAPLAETAPWRVTPGGKYYLTRNLTSLIAFRVPEGAPSGAMIVAAHSDSPSYAVGTASPERRDARYTRLSVEKYGGMLAATWMDRPLSVSGVLTVCADNTLKQIPVTIDRDLIVIPSLAIHMDRQANDGATYRTSTEMQPLYGDGAAPDLLPLLAEAAGVDPADIVSTETWLYLREKPRRVGASGEYILSPRLDDLMCAWGGLTGLIEAPATTAIQMFALFDSEEVGSASYQGAGSDLLRGAFERLTAALGMDEDARRALLARSFLVSADNAHAVHPNHPEKADPLYAPRMNGGVVIKHNANRRYVTDAFSEGVFREICRRAGVPTQDYRNHPDIPGGSTLGCISNGQLSLHAVDIGMAQLAMHAACETAGAQDATYLRQAVAAFYGTALCFGDGNDPDTVTLA